MKLQNVTLEMSLKPFRQMDEAFVAGKCRELFTQWSGLIAKADGVSILLWTAEGSEILTYRGNPQDSIEWARYIGKANPQGPVAGDPESIGLHSRPYLYMENPPTLTYATLKMIVSTLKAIGREVTGKPVRVGTTFDPGSEFAVSPFKYKLHNEICLGSTDGPKSWVCCYARLNADTTPYAAYPGGIPQDTPLGTFLGRQSRLFMRDLGFDYIWFSNGFGFGLETWRATGAMFDGERFDGSRARSIRDDILTFWREFHAACPEFPIETRGTNLGIGIDLASDAVPHREIYAGGFNMMTPPNSPWASIDGDFGIELSGYMSRIAELPPGKGFPFRYYTHDPWWLNSPWLDRYGRHAHDIYLPLAIGRINGEGRVENPSSFNFLSIDNSYGEMPDQVPQEVIPHMLHAARHAPDAPGPLVWVYPFDEYHQMTFGVPPRLEETYFGDWFIRAALNNGLPLNTVVSTRSFLSSMKSNAAVYAESILMTPVPDAGTPLSRLLLEHVENGGRVVLYGPLAHAGRALIKALNAMLAMPISGALAVELHLRTDNLAGAKWPSRMVHRAHLCGGGYDAMISDPSDAYTHVAATVSTGVKGGYLAAMSRALPAWKGGRLAWVRGTNPNSYKAGDALLTPDNPEESFHGDLLLRYILSDFGYDIRFHKQMPRQRNPVLAIARHENGFFFSGYMPNTNVELNLKMPQGAPVLIGHETMMENSSVRYHMPRDFHEECRVFVEQAGGEISCVEQCAVAMGIRRRIYVAGLKDATLRFFPERASDKPLFHLDAPFPVVEPTFVGDFRKATPIDDALGRYFSLTGVSGNVLISW